MKLSTGLSNVALTFSSHSGLSRAPSALSMTAKVFSIPSDKNNVKHLSHRAGDCLQLLLKRAHLGNEGRRDADFLGYEAFCHLNMVTTFGLLSPGKATGKANESGFTEPENETLSQEAA